MMRALPRIALTLAMAGALALSPVALAGPADAAVAGPAPAVPAGTPAVAESPAVADAIRLLGRQPPGRTMPAPSVLQAVDTLGEQGSREHLPLLAALGLEESPALAHRARLAHAAVVERERRLGREAFASTLVRAAPPAPELENAAPRRPDGSLTGPTERALLAYTRGVLGERPAIHPEDAADDEVDLVIRALQAEDRGQHAEALGLHALAAAQGHAGARAALAAHGVDADRLLLGLALSPVESALQAGPHELLRHLQPAGHALAVEVYTERLDTAGPRLRIQAMRALNTLMHAEASSTWSRRVTRAHLERVAEQGDELERAAAMLALVEPASPVQLRQ